MSREGMLQVAGLDPREIHVWTLDPDGVSDPEELQACRALLSDAEGTRHERFHFDRDRHRFLVAHALVRRTLPRHADVAPAVWTFEEGEFGRPEIRAPALEPALRFNLSHTAGLVACGVGLARDLGVDVEDTERRGETVKLARRFFSPDEVAALEVLPEEDQRDRFFDYWTLKESYIKARGMGLQIPLEQFSFQLPEDEREPIGIRFDSRLGDDPASWQFALFRPTARHRLAVAVRRPGEPDLNIRVLHTPAPGVRKHRD